jgi:hypothetical protein
LINGKQFDEAVTLGTDYLIKNPCAIAVLYYTGAAMLQSAKSAKAEEYLHKYQGLISSIIASGDGKSPESAYIVISLADEYTVLQYLGYTVSGQVLQDRKKHFFDLLTCINPAGEEHLIWFNIDKPFGSLNKQLR